MTPENKYRINRGLKVFGLFIWAVLTIATCAVVWNAKAGASATVLAGILLVVNAVVIFLIAKSMKTPAIEDWHLENPVEASKKK